jgi:hypothetical protein
MMIRGQFSDFFNETMLPALNAKIWSSYRETEPMMPKLLREDSTSRSIEQFSQMAGVGLLSEVGEGIDTPTDNFVQGFDRTFKPAKFGLGIAATQELVEDDKIGIVSQRAVALGRSTRQTIEIQGASVFNNAFDVTNYPGSDAVALCSATHPLIKAGGTQSNILSVAADLDVTSLELAMTDWETIKTAEGFIQMWPTPRLLVAPANRWNANEILRSDKRSDTANNTANAFKYAENGIPQLLVWKFLTDPDAWFLVAPPSETGLLWLWRKKPYIKSDYVERNETGYVYQRYRATYGFHDWRGIYGTPGA